MKLRLTGTRRNKVLPIARTPRFSDFHPIVRDWAAGRMSHDAAAEEFAYALRDGLVKPDHAVRAVDLATCFPPAPSGDRGGRAKGRAAGARGRSAAPISSTRREQIYVAQGATLGLTRTVMTARQARHARRMEAREAYRRELATT